MLDITNRKLGLYFDLFNGASARVSSYISEIINSELGPFFPEQYFFFSDDFEDNIDVCLKYYYTIVIMW